MAHHKIKLGDESGTEDALVSEPVLRRPYLVVNELFKNGKTYKPGSTIELDERTAANFIEIGDVEEIEEQA